MNSIKLAPDVDYKKSFGTAGPNVTWAVGAYSALTLRFGKIILQSPAIVWITITMTYLLDLVLWVNGTANWFK